VCPGAVGITAITGPNGQTLRNRKIATPVAGFSYADDQAEVNMLRGVLGPIGTAASAAIPGVKAWGKTGTTSNYEDAWFVGSTPRIGNVPSMTIAVWVGYPDRAKPMRKNFGGKPVYGGTFPAEIWRSFVEQMLVIYRDRAAGIRVAAPRFSTATHGSTGATSATTQQAGTTGTTGTTSAGAPTGGTTSPTGGTTSATGATFAPAGGATAGTTGGTTPTTGTTSPTVGATGTTTPPATPPVTNSSGGVSAPTGST
jgi:penicillin-binding protein 1A